MAKIRLSDLVPVARSVTISAGEVDVRHLSVGDLAGLAARHPAIVAAISGQPGVPLDLLAQTAPVLFAEVVALGAGEEIDNAVEITGRLTPDDQLTLFHATVDATFPRGIADFFGRLSGAAEALAPSAGEGDTQSAPVIETGDHATLDPDLLAATSA